MESSMESLRSFTTSSVVLGGTLCCFSCCCCCCCDESGIDEVRTMLCINSKSPDRVGKGVSERVRSRAPRKSARGGRIPGESQPFACAEVGDRRDRVSGEGSEEGRANAGGAVRKRLSTSLIFTSSSSLWLKWPKGETTRNFPLTEIGT